MYDKHNISSLMSACKFSTYIGIGARYAPVNHSLTHCILGSTLITLSWDGQSRASSVDPDQMLWNVVSDQGLHCLAFIQQFL